MFYRSFPPYPFKLVGQRLLFPLVAVIALLLSGPLSAQARDAGGYRSAHLGMDEAAVLEAIEADFAISPDSVERSANTVEKTTSLTVTVSDLVDFTGRTEISYIFGYRTKKLVQVNLVWRVRSKFVGATQRLKWAAKAMANRFALWGLSRTEIGHNTKTRDGATILFRSQAESGMIASISLKVPSEDKASLSVSLSVDEGYWLRVAFIENTSAPDIFKIEPGQF